MWEPVNKDLLGSAQETKKSLTYWQDVWRRLRQNIMAMTGLIMIAIVVFLAIFGPMFSGFSYSEQNTALANIAPNIQITNISGEDYVLVHNDYKLIEATKTVL